VLLLFENVSRVAVLGSTLFGNIVGDIGRVLVGDEGAVQGGDTLKVNSVALNHILKTQ